MNRDHAILLVDFASFYTTKHGQKRHFFETKIHDENSEKHVAKNKKHQPYDVKHEVEKNRRVMYDYFSEKFFPVEIFVGYTGRKDIKKLKMDHGIKLEYVQDVLEEIKTAGYMFTYVMPLCDRGAIGYDELKGEIEERISFGCFSDIILVEDIKQLEEVIKI